MFEKLTCTDNFCIRKKLFQKQQISFCQFGNHFFCMVKFMFSSHNHICTKCSWKMNQAYFWRAVRAFLRHAPTPVSSSTTTGPKSVILLRPPPKIQISRTKETDWKNRITAPSKRRQKGYLISVDKSRNKSAADIEKRGAIPDYKTHFLASLARRIERV